MSAEQLTVAVIGAGGKMGMRVSRNLQKSAHTVFYSENSPAGQDRVRHGSAGDLSYHAARRDCGLAGGGIGAARRR